MIIQEYKRYDVKGHLKCILGLHKVGDKYEVKHFVYDPDTFMRYSYDNYVDAMWVYRDILNREVVICE